MDVKEVGGWLWRGGRIRLRVDVATNGGVQIPAGTIMRLKGLVPYASDSAYFGAEFISVDGNETVLYVSGWGHGTDDSFELIES